MTNKDVKLEYDVPNIEQEYPEITCCLRNLLAFVIMKDYDFERKAFYDGLTIVLKSELEHFNSLVLEEWKKIGKAEWIEQ